MSAVIIWFLWLELCFVLAVISVFWTMLMKTHAKANQTATRANLIAPVAKTANTANTTANTATTNLSTLTSNLSGVTANASFLAGLSRVGGVPTWPTFGGSPTLAELTADVQNGVSSVNALLASMVSNGFI